MTGWILPAVPVVPLILAALMCWPRAQQRLRNLLPWAAVPAVLAALILPVGSRLDLPWLLLGTTLGLDDVSRVFLAASALLWLVAGIYARAYLREDRNAVRFALFWLLTLAGNVGLIIADDVASFYTFFALMTFAAYGLVIHSRTPRALRAGRVYLTMAVLGEGMIIAGLLLAVTATGETELALLAHALGAQPAALTVGLLLAGFGVKAGLPMLHMWLPLAHPVAPTPASAVLSGAMIKAGLLAWLKVMPLGAVALPQWGESLIAIGLLGAFGAALIGAGQRDPKAVLAYSSISQMGLITTLVGAGLMAPSVWPKLLSAVSLYVVHHAFAKASLFLAVGVADHGPRVARGWLWLGVALPALALAGLPWTSGGAAKIHAKDILSTADIPALAALPLWFGFAAVGTTLLMGRFLYCLNRRREDHSHDSAAIPGLLGPWVLSLLLTWGGAWALLPDAPPLAAAGAASGSLLWPPAAGAALALLAWAYSPRYPAVAPGDIIALLERGLRPLHAALIAGGQALSRCVARCHSAAIRLAHRLQAAMDLMRSHEFALRQEFALAFAAVVLGVLGLVLLG